MGHKSVCLECRKSFSQGTDFRNRHESNCPDCGEPLTMMLHSFRSPKKSDLKKWETIKFLVEHGFIFQHVYKDFKLKHDGSVSYSNPIKYPENLREAKDFVERYKQQAQKENIKHDAPT